MPDETVAPYAHLLRRKVEQVDTIVGDLATLVEQCPVAARRTNLRTLVRIAEEATNGLAVLAADVATELGTGWQ